MTRDPEAQLVRELGLRQLTAHIFNYTVGSGIFVLPAIAVAQLGTAAPLAYLVCATVMALVVMVFMEAGSRVTITGGPYAYVEVGLGSFFGFVTGVLLAVATISAGGAIAALLGQTAARLLGLVGPAWSAAMTLLLVTALVAVNVRGLRWGARLVEWSTAAKLVPLLAFVLVGAWFVDPGNLRIDTWPSASQVTATSGVLVFAFLGIESALGPTGEVRDAARTVPRAVALALLAATLLYLAIQLVALGVLGPLLAADTVAPLASAAGTFAGDAGAAFLLAGATISMLGWVTGAVLAAPRTFFALARDGFLPRQLALVHARHHTPHVAIVFYGVAVALVSLTGTFAQLAVVANLAVLAVYALGALAVLALRRKDVRSDDGVAPLRIPGGALVPVLTCVLIGWIAWQTTTLREAIAFAVVWAVALPVYLWRRRRAAHSSPGTT
ncbi:MAG TPA: APC family permease [Steroidobacteraceae bacterium]|nr:APC family permease [Steroidobacteraceae bacterium]